MKKLLLTLLGVMILCGLSPHTVTAQDINPATLDDGTPVIDVAKASALTTDLDGQLVRLQFPVNVLASGTMDGATKCKYMIYGRDPENNPVVMMSKVATDPSGITSSNYIPGTSAFQAATANTYDKSAFIPVGGVVGKAVAEKGHIIIVIRDSDNGVDFSDYCYKGSAQTYSSFAGSGINMRYAYTSNTHHQVDNITAADYGCMAWIRNVSYIKTENKFTDKDGNEIPVVMAPTSGTKEKYINAYSTTNYKQYNPPTADKTNQSICGIVELDENGEPYLMLRNIVDMVNMPTIKLPTASQYITFTENEEKTAGQVTVNHTSNSPQISCTPTLATYGISSYFFNNNGYEDGSIDLSTGKNATIYLTNIIGPNRTFMVEGFNPKTANKTIPSDRSEPYTLTLIDPILSATPYPSFAEINAAKPDEGTAVMTSTKYFQPYSLPYKSTTGSSGNKDDNWPLANGMVAYLRGNYMLVRDIARNEDGSLASLQEEDAPFYILKRDNWANINSVTVDHSGGATGGMSLSKRSVAEGDGVAKISGIMTYENNNPVINLNQSYMPTAKSHQLKSTPTDVYFTLEFEGNATSIPPALFAEQLEEWRISSVISDAAETTLDASYVGKVVEIKGVSIAKDGEAYTIGMKQPVGMSWFEGDAGMAQQQAILATADADAMYTLSGYVMNDGQGGVEIKLLSLDNTGEIIEVCEHPGHESYYGELSLDAYVGKVITLTGARIYQNTDDNSYYTPVGSEKISFEWSTNPDGETTDKAAIKATSTDISSTLSRFATAMLHDISAKVKKDGDTYTLDILSIKALSALNADEFGPDDMNVYVDGVPAKNTGTQGSSQAYIYSTLTDFVKLKAEAPEWSQVVYAIVSENGTKISNPEWKPLEAGVEMKIDHPMELYVAGCSHGHKTQSVRRLYFEKTIRIANVDKLSGLIDYKDTETDPDKQKTHLLMTGSARVVATATVDGKPVAVVTGNDGNHYLLRSNNADAELPEVGTMISNFATKRILADGEGIGDINTAYTANLNHDFADYAFTPDPDEELPALTPVAITNEHSTANAEKHIRLYDVKIGTDASGLTVTAGASSIRLNNVFGCEIDDNDEDAQYVMTGIMLPRQGKSIDRQEIATLADAGLTLDDMEFLPLAIEKRRATAEPTYTLTGYESFEEGLAVTIADVELSMECDEPYSTVSYSLDGGENWTTYNGTEVKITESAKVVIKASVLGFDDTTVSFEIRREYFSTEATLTPTAKGGYTEVVIAPAGDLAADSYKIYYTTDGTEPTAESALYTDPIECDKAASIRALVIENGKRPGKASDPVAVSVRANDLEITPEKGEGFTTVTIAPKDPKHVDPKAEIRYTTDGTEPTAASKLYTAPFEVEAADNGMTVKAICIEPQKTNGLVATQTVAVEGLRPSCDVTITYREKDGVYYITLTAEAGTIHYSLNGAEEKIYDDKPIEYTPAADGTCTITAYALEEGKKAGKTATESFAVTGISGIGADEAESVSVEGNTIIVPEGAQTFDIAGRRVNPQGLPRGIYIVRLASGKAVKAVVK